MCPVTDEAVALNLRVECEFAVSLKHLLYTEKVQSLYFIGLLFSALSNPALSHTFQLTELNHAFIEINVTKHPCPIILLPV